MGSIDDIMQLCRLCLVKDQVNIPIFEETSDIGQTFLKINSCLPVKVSREDNLPKKICDGCSYKLDMLYIFRNTSADSEKQLISWLNQAGLSQVVKEGVTKPEIMVKQETFETGDARIEENPEMGAEAPHPALGLDAHNYIMQQQKLPYQQEFAFGEPSGSSAGLIPEEPAPKKAKRAAAIKKHVPLDTDEDELDTAMQITKAEDEDSDDIDQAEFVEAPSTSADDQPGPSGVGKGTIEAPSPVLQVKQEIDSDVDPLSTHIQMELPVLPKQFMCEICGKEYLTKRKLGKHKQTHKEKTQSCDQCSMKFTTPYLLRKHKIAHEITEKTHYCDLCDKSFKNENSVKQHRLIHTKDYKFKCDLCSNGYKHEKALSDHKLVIHENVRFVCETCKKSFKDKYCYKAHLKSHDPDYVKKTWTCLLCQRVCQCKATLKRHMADHANTRETFVCEVCGRCYISKNFLRDHMKVHTGQNMSICEVCGKRFISKERLKEHMRVHTKERPFICSVCKKGFTQRGALNTHMRTHTGKKPYKCGNCTKCFTTNASLRSHKCLGR